MPIPDDNLVTIQKECVELDDDVRWLVALISDTGMRLAMRQTCQTRSLIYCQMTMPNVLIRNSLVRE